MRHVLESMKIPFHLEKAFKRSVDNGLRSIWFLSFEGKYEIIKEIIKKYDHANAIIMMPVSKCLQVMKKRMNISFAQSFPHDMRRRFPHIY